MQRRTLGQTGFQVGTLGFGGLFASRLGPGFEESRAAGHHASVPSLPFRMVESRTAFAPNTFTAIAGKRTTWCSGTTAH